MSQDLAPDIKGLATEIKFHEKKLEKSKQLKKMGDQLRRRVPLWRYYMAKSFIVFLPFYDDNPRQIFPFATIGLIALNLLVFIFSPSNSFALHAREAMGADAFYSAVTAIFMHAGLLHLLVNMFFLWTFGDNVEEKLGPAKYLSLYVTCGLVVSLLLSLATPAMVSPTVAASGAVAGILGSYIYYFPTLISKHLSRVILLIFRLGCILVSGCFCKDSSSLATCQR
ncbi:MAG: rhomboid family intramembrane serine protease [Bdellovibrionales bacterium]|nr:rhomboid family intramembrane serine protease [Bdellovibrionales bacterium]